MSLTRRQLMRRSVASVGWIGLAGSKFHGDGHGHPDATPGIGDVKYLVTATGLIGIESVPQFLAVMDVTTFQIFPIPGTVQIGWEELSLGDTSGAAVEAWSTRMQELFAERGLCTDQHIIVYAEGTLFAARGWWQLSWMGRENVPVLDGGLPAWNKAGGDVEEGVSGARLSEAPGIAAERQSNLLATRSEVLASLTDPNVLIIDARSRGEYDGGHSPGAANVPYTDNAIGGDIRIYLSPERLRELYEAIGMTHEKRAITCCSTGVRGSVAAFAMHLAGFSNVGLYIGSWSDRIGDPAAPVE